MTAPAATVTNSAGPSATVGVQADTVENSTVHISTIYQVHPNDPPPRKYEVGVKYLRNGVPGKARELIRDAIVQGHDSSKVRFHWLLAMLSKRTYQQLSPEEREELRRGRSEDHPHTDKWTHGVHAIHKLVECLEDPALDSDPALKELRALEEDQRAQVKRHLDAFLTGPIKDKLWAETRDAAKKDQRRNDRAGRVWAYFYPDPARPRVRGPWPMDTGVNDRRLAGAITALFVGAVICLGWLALPDVAAVVAFPLAVVGGYLAARYGLEWRYRVERLRAKDRDYVGNLRPRRAPWDGFANRVDRLFDHYFHKYVPRGADRHLWLADTTSIRNTLRDEVVQLYRESRVKDKQVSWLIRHMVNDIKTRWTKGTLFDYRRQYRTPAVTKAACVLGLAMLVPASIWVVGLAVRADPLQGLIASVVALPAGWMAAKRWLWIISEHRRHAEDEEECERHKDDRWDAYQRWERRLLATRPSEEDMERWLDCDRKLLLDRAMRHYKLAWRDVIAHGFLQTPASPYQRARMQRGPLRYSRYELRLFLITADGVREFTTQLNFEHATWHGERRANYRFDAVASIHVTKRDLQQTFELTLVNGRPIEVPVTDSDIGQLEPGEDPKTLTEVTLDAAGLGYTLHILEGMAAEGKQWIDRGRQNNRGLADEVDDLIG